MKFNELSKEINFGLENLNKIYQMIQKFLNQKIEEEVKTSALTYDYSSKEYFSSNAIYQKNGGKAHRVRF